MGSADASLDETARPRVGSKEIAMHTRGVRRLALMMFCLAVCVAFSGGYAAIVHAHARDIPSSLHPQRKTP
jgi:hypothetical protein